MILLGAMSVVVTVAQDAVDKLSHHFETLPSEGLEKLHQREGAELEQVREVALADKNLELATKANTKIEEVKLAILVKGGDAVHLKPFSEAIPEMYLSIKK